MISTLIKKKKDFRILLIGLDSAGTPIIFKLIGKTTFLYKIKSNENITSINYIKKQYQVINIF
jgi:hypothetical protein